MDMLARFQASTAPRPAEAKKIPNLAVNFVDVTNQFQDGFTLNEQVNDPTKFTDKAMGYFATETKNISYPDGFNPVELGATPNQWGPTNKYVTPGETGIFGTP